MLRIVSWYFGYVHSWVPCSANLWWKALPGVLRDSGIWESRILCFIVVVPHQCTNRDEDNAKSKLATLREWEEVWFSVPTPEQIMATFSSLFNQLDPRIEVAYLQSIWCTLLLSIWMIHGLGAFSSFHSSSLRLLSIFALFKLQFHHSLFPWSHVSFSPSVKLGALYRG